ncbi:MAG: SPW repeat protein [Candidatus Binatia bacterium]
MLPMIPLTLDEVVAMCQFMAKSYRDGKPFWRTFWQGDTIEGGGSDTRSPDVGTFPQQPLQVYRAAVWGMSVPWTLVLSSILGLWLMFAPTVFGSTEAAADSNHLTGALIITIAVIAMAEVVRAGRLLNLILGGWLLLAPWVLAGASSAATINTVLVGVAILGLSLPRGKICEHYGTWDRYVV